jgi:hypothetical protein
MAKKSSLPKIGKLPPMYRFILNPHTDVRFSTCPNCEGKMLVRKVPLFIHVQPHYPTTINKHSRYCPKCDILIVHQDELEHRLALTYEKRQPEIIGNEYLVLGTLEPSSWRNRDKEPLVIEDVLDHVHDFKERLEVKYTPAHWGPADKRQDIRRKK